MLAALTVRDIVLIETAALDFAPGLNVLTGETGAGKSILLDALGLAVGGRGGGRVSLRPGAAQGSASALFDPPRDHPARTLLAEQSIPHDGEILLRRTLAADGRSRAYVNDEPVGVQLLKELGALLLEVHGQSGDIGLFDANTHRVLLDAFGGHAVLAGEVAARFAAHRAAAEKLDALRRDRASAEAEAEDIRQVVAELEALDAGPGEEAALAAERALLMNAARLAEETGAACELLSGERGAESNLAGALKKLSRLGEEAKGPLAAANAALEAAFASAEEARRELEAFLARLEADPSELDRKEERLFAIRAAARKYVTAPDALPEKLAAFRARRDLIDMGADALKAAEADAEAVADAWRSAAKKLTLAREAAALRLEAAVAGELVPLKLGHAKFHVAIVPLEAPAANGAERVQFEIATIAGAPFGPLAKIASGGELARFSLAIKVALAESDPPAALVFDEVDRGVGGAVADAVGERLQRLAETTQVLLVTHAPQVAARAARHFRITRVKDRTRIELLDEDARIEEVARMLSGAAVTDEARAAAKRLIAEARKPQKKPQRKRA
jgi:DNA repair protein RecN (Recombination protein N)